MAFNNEASASLEQLLESLIKMVGKSNQKFDSLQVRIAQLEWIIKEQQQLLESFGRGRLPDYSTITPLQTSAETH